MKTAAIAFDVDLYCNQRRRSSQFSLLFVSAFHINHLDRCLEFLESNCKCIGMRYLEPNDQVFLPAVVAAHRG